MFGRSGGVSSHAPAATEGDDAADAAERKRLAQQKFDDWVHRKECFDRSLQLFAKLNYSRWDDDRTESAKGEDAPPSFRDEDERRAAREQGVFEVAIALAAIDRSLGFDVPTGTSAAGAGKTSAGGSKAVTGTTKARVGPQSMYEAFRRWCTEHHTFEMVKLTASELSSLSQNLQDMARAAAAQKASQDAATQPEDSRNGSSNAGEGKDESKSELADSRNPNGHSGKVDRAPEPFMPSLAYSFPPAPPRRGLKARPMTKDQLATNVLFLRRVRTLWERAVTEMRARLAKHVETSEIAFLQQKEAAAPRKRESKQLRSSGSAGRALHLSNLDGSEGQSGVTADRIEATRRDRFVANALSAMGTRQLAKWLEEDEDWEKVLAKRETEDRLKKASRMHDGFVKRKDGLRIRLPDEEPSPVGGVWKPPRFDFSGGKGLARPNRVAVAQTTAEIMRGQGLKVVHAIAGGDLDKSRQLVREQRTTEKRAAEELRQRREEERVRAFEEWSQRKGQVEAAKSYLKHIDSPSAVGAAAAASSRAQTSSTNSTAAAAGATAANTHWITVGRALKKVDCRLLRDWADWSSETHSAAHCQAVWDAFEPRACDVHSAGYSAIRETFLKLLRPGADYRAAFQKVVQWRNRRNAALKTKKEKEKEKGGGGSNDSSSDKDDKQDENNINGGSGGDVSLSKKDVQRLLTKELAIQMQPAELARLVDAFDSNGDQMVSWAEFEEFTGGTRGCLRGDAELSLRGRCVWQTTCRETGMPGAYVVSVLRPGEKSVTENRANTKAEGERGTSRSTDPAGRAPEWGGSVVLRELKTGETQRYVELPDRRKRRDLLERYGIISGGGRSRSASKSPDRVTDSYSDEEFEQGSPPPPRRQNHRRGRPKTDSRDGSYSPDPENGSVTENAAAEGFGRASEPCAASSWRSEDREAGLAELRRASKANREAQELKKVLETGSAPPPPKLSVAGPEDPDVGNGQDALCEELLLRWRAPAGAVVAFFSVEMAGGGSSDAFAGDSAAFREICRDPRNADEGPPELQCWVRDLQPNTAYSFRIRAVNGFGPGPYAHGRFSTRPRMPPPPVAVRVTPTEVLLRWKFSSGYTKRLQELKKIFAEIDADGSGEVSRDELLAALETGHQGLLTFLKQTTLDGAPATGAALSVFDAIEATDDEALTWDEFARYFSNGGALDRTGAGAASLNDLAASSGSSKAGKTRYTVEQCESEEDNRWREAWNGTAGEAGVKGLSPGGSYRFRVKATNADGVAGAWSESLVVNTLLEPPAAPSIAAKPTPIGLGGSSSGGGGAASQSAAATGLANGNGAAAVGASSASACGYAGAVTCSSVRLRWPAGSGGRGSARGKEKVDKMLAEWTKAGLGVPGGEGVSVEAIFSRYDVDGNGSIDPVELANLLGDLGVEPTEERLRQAFADLDADRNSRITLEEFEAWWRRDQIVYVLKRDAGVSAIDVEGTAGSDSGSNLLSSGTNAAASSNNYGRSASNGTNGAAGAAAADRGASVTSYRGEGLCTEVAGLSPSTLYTFRMRIANARTQSVLSPPLVVMTAPQRPEPAVVVRTDPKAALLKWYPGYGGAYKYVLQRRFVESLDGGSGAFANVVSNTKNANNNYNNGNGNSNGNSNGRAGVRPSTTSGGGGRGRAGEEAWVCCYEGADNTFLASGLAVNSVYRFRVAAVNVRGVASEWSDGTQVSTGLSDKATKLLKPAAAASVFVADANGDMAVGDTVIFTERLYVDSHGRLMTNSAGSASASASAAAANVTTATLTAARSQRGRLGGGSVLSLASAGVENGYKSVLGGSVTGNATGEFIGERTVAAHVLQDSYLALRRKQGPAAAVYDRSAAKRRQLRLEVLWSTVSRSQADAFVLTRGTIVERPERELFQFETFRALWDQDEGRKSVAAEWALLSGVV